MSRYQLPELPYDYAALEPHLDARIVELHHDKHHRAYVTGANDAIEALLEARSKGDFKNVHFIERTMAFNVSGHVLHSIYWQNMSPDGGGEPTGELAADIIRDFGSFDAFKKQLTHVAATTMGSGWAALVYEPILQRLGITQIHDHQTDVTQGSVPLLVLDAWEHAYYLQYQTDKGRYFEAMWNLWNWDDVAARLRRARSLDLGVANAAAAPKVADDELRATP